MQAYNDSQSVPLLPEEIAWLMEIVEQRLHNRSSLPLQLERAVTLAHYTSAVYCSPENIRAWNCSRCCTTSVRCTAVLRPYGAWNPSVQSNQACLYSWRARHHPGSSHQPATLVLKSARMLSC